MNDLNHRTVLLQAQLEKLLFVSYEKADIGIMWHDGDGRLLACNHYLCDVLGYSLEELLIRKIWGIDAEGTKKEFEDFFQSNRNSTGVYNEERCLKTREGVNVAIDISAHFVRFEETTLVCSFVQDIRDRIKKDRELNDALQELAQLTQRLEVENRVLKEELRESLDSEKIVGESPAIVSVLKLIEQVAPLNTTVLLLGETGTGKELLARAVHRASPRQDRPLVVINCAALPSELIENELFGHEKGAYTNAQSKQIGRFELADKGTLLLDEVGELPLALQAKLLRVLQEGEFERVGGTDTIKVDVRIVAATNIDLQQAVNEGSFRKDLYFRLNVFPIESPPLRSRKEDIPALVHHFLSLLGREMGKNVEFVPPDVMATLSAYHWPGNIRELANVMERGLILSSGNELELFENFGGSNFVDSSELKTLKGMEAFHIREAMIQSDGRVRGEGGAAQLLDVKPTTLESKMKRLGITKPSL
jgi:formate hydrogenlyase transcriptional activator